MKPSTPKTDLPYQVYDWSLYSQLAQTSKEFACNAWDPGSKGMATHSSILAWKTPWTEEPGGLQSTGSQRIWNDWVTNTFTIQNFIPFGAPSDLNPVLIKH